MIGSVVGNYKIIDKIGEGGMGAVFKGVDLMLEREVAIKMLRPELARQPNVVERFRTEAVTLAKLNHPNVATLHSFFRQADDFFMVMEFVRGETLDNVIRAQGAMQCAQAIELFCMALEGIDHAHQMGIVHRDIKPANMMLTETGSIKVMDFGIARVLGTDRMTKAGHLIGTVEYMSPEQVRGEETDARSDIYSLGTLLYEMLTGRVPFNSTSEYELMRSQIEDTPTPPRALAPQVPVAVEQAIMCALSKKPEARYQSASEFRETLIQKTTGSVTKVDATPASYVTRESELIVSTPSGQVIKETRLAGDPGVPVALGAQLIETPLAPTIELPAGYQQSLPPNVAPQPQAGGSLGSLLGKFNWKHYAAAAALLVALISLPIVLLGGGGRSTATPPEPPPAAAPAQSVAPGTEQPPSAQPGDQGGGASGSGNTEASRTSDAAGSKPAQSDSSAAGSTATQGESTAQKKSSSGPKAAKRNERKQKQSETKTTVDKVGEAAGAVGGAIKKKLGGVFSKKKP
jgi:serine/threonine-protein kinase